MGSPKHRSHTTHPSRFRLVRLDSSKQAVKPKPLLTGQPGGLVEEFMTKGTEAPWIYGFVGFCTVKATLHPQPPKL